MFLPYPPFPMGSGDSGEVGATTRQSLEDKLDSSVPLPGVGLASNVMQLWWERRLLLDWGHLGKSPSPSFQDSQTYMFSSFSGHCCVWILGLELLYPSCYESKNKVCPQRRVKQRKWQIGRARVMTTCTWGMPTCPVTGLLKRGNNPGNNSATF